MMPVKPIPEIDVGEALLARSGIGHALSSSSNRVWIRQDDTRLEDSIRAKAKAFTADAIKPVKVTLPSFNYDTILDQFSSAKAIAPASLGRLDADESGAYIVAADRARQYLDDQLPKSTITDMVSQRNIRPSDMTIAGFRRLYAVAEDPMTVLQALVDGTLTPDQVTALKTMFPTVYEAAKEILFEEINEKLAGDVNWHLPFRRDYMLQIFTETPSNDAAAVKALQQNFANAKDRAAVKQADEPKPPARGAAKAVETQVQRASQ